jgi:hypothetical protein
MQLLLFMHILFMVSQHPFCLYLQNTHIMMDIQNSSWESFQLSLNSLTKKWEKVGVVEIQGFMACTLYVGVIVICKYRCAPICTGNIFQDLPRLRETVDNTERYT